MDLKRYKNLTWSGETYSLKEIVKSKGLPCLVMVSEGIYSTSEMASFSSGDVLKLEALKNIYSIIAQNAARSASTGNLEGYGPLVHIPVRYSARGSIVPLCSPSHIFTSVKSLIHAFPRYVSTCEPMEIYHGRAVKTIPEGDTLELQNDLLSGGGTRSAVSCMWRGERITLSSRNKVRLRILEDRRKYSVKDVMKHLKLPQGIEFAANSLNPIVTSELVDGVSNASQFTGTFLLKGVFREAIVIAHQCAYTDDGKKVGSIVVMQMADSQINELEFYVADQDDSNYEILLRNFSSTSPDKKPGVCLYADFITPNMAPVVPVRTWQHDKKSKSVGDLSSSAKTPSSSNDDPTSASDDDDDDYVFPPEEFSGSGSPADTKPSEKSKAHVSKLDPIKRFADKVPQKMKTSKDFLFNNLKTKLHVKEAWDIPKPKRVSTKDEFENEYQYPDISKIMNEIHEEEQKEEQEKKYKRFPTDTMAKNVYIEMKTRGHLTQSKIASRPPMPLPKKFSSSTAQPLLVVKPILSVKPQVLPEEAANDSSSKEQSKRLIEATVTELCKVLKTCGLFNLEKICEKNKLDGKFISSLSEEDLKKLPFNLNDLEIIKIRMMLKGWTPKVT